MVTVLGAGISGLSASYYLFKRFGKPSAVFEASNRIGGWIRTEKHKDKGFIFEHGPRTIRTKGLPGANTLAMIEDLELDIEPIPSSHVAAKNRLIYAKGQICMLPNSLLSILQANPPFSKSLIMTIFNDLRMNRNKIKYGDESIYSFINRRFGSELADYGISPLICGICAGDAKQISVRFLLNELFELEQQFGGIIKGMVMSRVLKRKKLNERKLHGGGLFVDDISFLYRRALKEKWIMYRTNDGLETLPRSLAAYLRKQNVDINLSYECDNIQFKGNWARIKVRSQEMDVKHVISSIPSYKLAPCVKDQHPGLAGQLLSIQYVDVAVVNLQYNEENIIPKPAFGILVPPIEGKPILGMIFDSCCFDMEKNTVITVMMGGAWFEEHFGKDPTKKLLLDTALKEIEAILKITREPRFSRVHILRKCIPQYNVGHSHIVESIRQYIKRYNLPLSVCGAAYDGVGINDVILSARKCVEELPEVCD